MCPPDRTNNGLYDEGSAAAGSWAQRMLRVLHHQGGSKLLSCDISHILIYWHIRPVFLEHLARKFLNLAKRHGFKAACTLKAEGKAPN